MRETPDNFKETEIGPVPVDWEVGPLKDFAVFARKPRGLDLSAYKAVPFISMELVPDEGVLIEQYDVKSGQNIRSGTYCEKGDILLAKITPSFENGKQGIVGDIPLDFAYATTEVYPIRGRPSHLDQMFLFYLFRLPTIRASIAGKMEGSTGRQRVPKAVMENYPIPLPPLPEQRRIAYVLSTIQQAIAAQDDLIATAREVKRSLMQRLFTYGPNAELAPTKETEIGEIPQHWGVVQLENVVDVKGGKRLPKGHKFADGPTAYPYIRVIDFQDNSVNKSALMYLTPKDYERIKRYTISSKDVYISIAGTTGLVGTVPQELDGANLTENAAKLVIRNRQRLLKHFLVYALASERGQVAIRERTTKTSQPKLALMRIKRLPIPFPPPVEQKRIADILIAADRKVQTEQQRKAVLKALFQSLLHQLMTGQIRLKDAEL